MSIEQDLTRIAVALEEMVKRMPITANANMAAPTLPAKETKAKKEASPVVAPEPEVDPFASGDTPTPVVTFESLTDLLKIHAKQLGTKVTVALIVKHGADKIVPKMNTIPEANFTACFDEATADLKKLEKKGK